MIQFDYPHGSYQLAPENGWIVGIRSFPFAMTYFQVQTVSFRECNTVDGKNPAPPEIDETL